MPSNWRLYWTSQSTAALVWRGVRAAEAERALRQREDGGRGEAAVRLGEAYESQLRYLLGVAQGPGRGLASLRKLGSSLPGQACLITALLRAWRSGLLRGITGPESQKLEVGGGPGTGTPQSSPTTGPRCSEVTRLHLGAPLRGRDPDSVQRAWAALLWVLGQHPRHVPAHSPVGSLRQ